MDLLGFDIMNETPLFERVHLCIPTLFVLLTLIIYIHFVFGCFCAVKFSTWRVFGSIEFRTSYTIYLVTDLNKGEVLNWNVFLCVFMLRSYSVMGVQISMIIFCWKGW